MFNGYNHRVAHEGYFLNVSKLVMLQILLYYLETYWCTSLKRSMNSRETINDIRTYLWRQHCTLLLQFTLNPFLYQTCVDLPFSFQQFNYTMSSFYLPFTFLWRAWAWVIFRVRSIYGDFMSTSYFLWCLNNLDLLLRN